ncbi:hypothetical protein OU995_21440 [Roseateles sp. SL47]|uniref:hypothetical protein n=1 Tax=Roseateles sp. SL47 TaxID=2995138 RepID=UPI002270732D|nr:hypothetical protein [Roseateles sp. SL47]WAC72108.1 hypothetical protein OU995_21440 [Roseateles sp. SL47]
MSADRAQVHQVARVGDTITAKVRHPHPATLRITLTNERCLAYANKLLRNPASGWTLERTTGSQS